MHALMKTLSDRYRESKGVTSQVSDALDDVAQCIVRKEDDSRFPEDYGPVSLTHEEQTFLTVWGAWTMANGGGATEALDGVECQTLVDALCEVVASEIVDTIIRLNTEIEEFERANKELDWRKREEKFTTLKIGPWAEDDRVFFEPEDRIPRILVEYLLRNQSQIFLEGYET